MPLVLLVPLLTGGAGFGAGFWAGDNFGWMKWLIVAAVIFFTLFKLGVI
jgi:hypothetical protein